MQNNELILGITSVDDYTHDNSAALLKKGQVLFAASEERFTRIKHDGSFPQKAIKGGLNYLKIKPNSISTIAVGYPRRNISSIFYNQYFYELIPFAVNILINRNIKIFADFITLIKFFLKKSTEDESVKREHLNNKKIVYVDHHLAHAASGYYTSGLNKCISIALDAFGSQLSGQMRSGAVFLCQNGEMKEISSVPIFASLGIFYMSVTYALGFKPGDGEGKTMGLAAYGNPKKLYKSLRPYCPTFEDGVWRPGQDWLAGILPSMPKVAYLFSSTKFGQLLNAFLKNEKREDLAAAAQLIIEEELVKLVRYLIKKYPDYQNLTLSGGLFLNVKANKKLIELSGIKNIFVHPHAGDGGVALGAAFIATPKNYLQKIVNQAVVSYGLGESFTNSQILNALNQYSKRILFQKRAKIVDYSADQISKGKVIGWFQGRAEWGPRALGFRSVLADPRKIGIKNRINEVLKNREWFMPFAPSVLEEEASKYFKDCYKSPCMTIVFDVIKGKEKNIPAAIHIDNTARPNTVNSENNPTYYQLIKAYYKKTGLPVILNTSFNKHGLPVVNSPKDAVDHLLMGAVDELIIGKFSVQRNS